METNDYLQAVSPVYDCAFYPTVSNRIDLGLTYADTMKSPSWVTHGTLSCKLF